MQSADAGQNLGFTVDTRTLAINLKSGGITTPMNPVDRVSAQAYVTNNTDGHATITLFHNNDTDGTQSATWFAAPREQVGPLTVYFRLGLNVALVLDYWAIKMAVQDGFSGIPGITAATPADTNSYNGHIRRRFSGTPGHADRSWA